MNIQAGSQCDQTDEICRNSLISAGIIQKFKRRPRPVTAQCHFGVCGDPCDFRITSYNVCYTKLLRELKEYLAHRQMGLIREFKRMDIEQAPTGTVDYVI